MIETERLILRPHRLDDFEALHAIWTEPDVVRHITGRPSTRAESWDRLSRYAGQWALLGHGFLAAEEKASGAYVGDIGIGRFERGLGPDFDDFDEAGWILGPAAQGKGFATEAMTAILAWFAREKGPRRTVCIVSPENAASIRVAGKLGYRPFADRIFPGTEDDMVRLFERIP
ncbi:GNAT family N-acetyltransferase [Escherichia coli]|nr:GNAT family N-acetyltransferase [Escherichia coli]